VKVQLSQDIALERQAFLATLDLNNDTTLGASAIAASLTVLDNTSGQDVSSQFVLTNPTLTGLQAIDGSGTLAAQSSGQAQWTPIPSPGLGGTLSTGHQYEVSAHISYRLGGVSLTLDTLPQTITVRPQPSLAID
jgi:hypothetical protein